MTRTFTIDARWDTEAQVWLATSADVPGLVVEADSWPAMIEEVRLALPDLLELSHQKADKLSLIFGVGIWLFVEVGFLRGTQGPNRYGPDPLGQTQADAAL